MTWISSRSSRWMSTRIRSVVSIPWSARIRDDGAHDEIGLRFDVADDLISARDVRRHDSGDEAVAVGDDHVAVGRGARLEAGESRWCRIMKFPVGCCRLLPGGASAC